LGFQGAPCGRSLLSDVTRTAIRSIDPVVSPLSGSSSIAHDRPVDRYRAREARQSSRRKALRLAVAIDYPPTIPPRRPPAVRLSGKHQLREMIAGAGIHDQLFQTLLN
jgi:hypothetical protein